MGQPLATELRIKGDLTYEKYGPDLAGCIDTALKQRPEISQSTNAIQIAREGITIAKAGYLPTLSAVFQPGWYDSSFPGGGNYNWTGYLSTSWTIFDGGLTAGKVKQAVEAYHKAQEQLRQTVDTVRLDVQSSYLSLRAAEQSIATSRSAVVQAEESYSIKVLMYQVGREQIWMYWMPKWR
jgi:outer membrane protein TolC